MAKNERDFILYSMPFIRRALVCRQQRVVMDLAVPNINKVLNCYSNLDKCNKFSIAVYICVYVKILSGAVILYCII